VHHRHPLLFRGARVIDGSGGPSQSCDVAVAGGVIAEIAPPGTLRGDVQMDLDGRVLAPGFIDVHTHDDRYVLATPDVPAKVSQGVTTVVTGNCGISLAPLFDVEPLAPLDLLGERAMFRYATFASYLQALDLHPSAVNVAPMVGHTTLRIGCMPGLGEDMGRPANAQEIEQMRLKCTEALNAGAIGVSIGTFYPPASSATADEIVQVCAALTHSGAVLTAHLRDEGNHIDTALREVFAISRRLEAPLVVSHHKIAGLCNHGRSVQTLGLIDAVARDQDVSMDVYPYTASSTMLRWERVQMSARTLISWSRSHPELSGLTFEEACARLGLQGEAAVQAMLPAGATYFLMNQDDVDRIMCHPLSMIGSDGLPHDQRPHPRLWGSFPRVLGHYVRERKLLSLEQAVHKMTGLSARRFGLQRRGLIKQGHAADLVVFDPLTIHDEATFDDPVRTSAGIHSVWVHGHRVWADGLSTGARSGRTLRRQKT
jgi:N-acyl-D-aspartate/D-glutamate deacylase